MHRAAADVHDQHRALVREAQAVAEGGGHRLVHEAHPPDPQPLQELLHLGAIGLERRHRRRDDQVADALAGRALRLDEHLPQERARHLARAHGVPAEPRERPRGLARERGLEGRHERRVHGLAVALEGRAPDERATAQEHPPRDRGPAPQAVEEARVLEEVHRRGHHARRLERVVPLRAAADVGQLDELRLAGRLVPARDPRVRGAEVERPAGHRGPTLAGLRVGRVAAGLVIPRSPRPCPGLASPRPCHSEELRMAGRRGIRRWRHSRRRRRRRLRIPRDPSSAGVPRNDAGPLLLPATGRSLARVGKEGPHA